MDIYGQSRRWSSRRFPPAAASAGVRGQLIVPAVFVALAIVLVARDEGGYFPTSWGWSTAALAAVVVIWAVVGTLTDAGRFDISFILVLLLLSAWVAASIAFSVDPAQSVLELERWLVLLSGCGAFLALAQKRALPYLTIAVLVAITSIASYSLSTRLFPASTQFAPDDPISHYRLFAPMGYWNALGALCAIGTVLALGIVAEQRVGAVARIFAAASLAVLPLALFFTFSRGAWVALVAGACASLAISPSRLRLTSEAAIIAFGPAAAIVVATHATALTNQNASLNHAASQGHVLAAVVIALVLWQMAVAATILRIEHRASFPQSLRRAYGGALVAIAVASIAAVFIAVGSPATLATRSYSSFVAPVPPPETANLNSRYLSVNGNGRAQMWEIAIDALHGHWLTGTGAGSFERNWNRSPKANEVVRDAHGLYVETLSELGLVGLGLLTVMLIIPLVAAARTRTAPLVAALSGAYATFLLHNAVDWDWEVTGLSLTGLFVGCLLLVAARHDRERTPKRRVRVLVGTTAVPIAVIAVAAAVGNSALAAAQAANAEHRYLAAASEAATARRWMPWSAEPLKALGEAQFRQGAIAAARATFEKAASVDSADWQAWLDLAATERGDARVRAVSNARRLYPTSPEIAEFVKSAQTPTR